MRGGQHQQRERQHRHTRMQARETSDSGDLRLETQRRLDTRHVRLTCGVRGGDNEERGVAEAHVSVDERDV